jgi:hypothetical protein
VVSRIGTSKSEAGDREATPTQTIEATVAIALHHDSPVISRPVASCLSQIRRLVALSAIAGLFFSPFASLVRAAAPFSEFADPHPGPNNQFGAIVVVLATGNVVITSPGDSAAAPGAGAVYLFSGATGALISTLRGTSPGDQIGAGGVTALSSGNYVIQSFRWDNGSAADAGAVTWGNGITGVSGSVSAANSLVGSTANDLVGAGSIRGIPNTTNFEQTGMGGVVALTNGNYLVRAQNWTNGTATRAGAVTWGNGNSGVSGAVSASNSLVGTAAEDQVGSATMIPLPNGNYLVMSPGWNNGATVDAGAVTWGNGSTGIVGPVSVSNSLYGANAKDVVGFGARVTALTNGNFVVLTFQGDPGMGAVAGVGAATWGNGATGVAGPVSTANSLLGSTHRDGSGSTCVALPNGNYVLAWPDWDNGGVANVGAVTWGNGATGVKGVVSMSNSLVGATNGDRVGRTLGAGVVALTNGAYVVSSEEWDNGPLVDAGAVTWGNATSGVTGTVGASNSLVGSSVTQRLGRGGATPLTNGNYVVTSSWRDASGAVTGAATFGNGSTGIVGVVTETNSLVGSKDGEAVGEAVTALSNGNYVVQSPGWNKPSPGSVGAGAVTWGDGAVGTTGVVSISNSLVGSRSGDAVGSGGVTVLANGNYVVKSPQWFSAQGSVTWGRGTGGTSGLVSEANSLVGSAENDGVGQTPDINRSVTAMVNGNYVVSSPRWDNGALVDAGAVTLGNGSSGTSGRIGPLNSLVGGAGDQVGSVGVTALGNGNYVVRSAIWHNGSGAAVGAVTWGDGSSPMAGSINASNSLVGSTAGDLGGSVTTVLGSGNYVVTAPNWDSNALVNAGAITWGSANAAVTGVIGSSSVVGQAASANLQTAIPDDINGNFIGVFSAEQRVRVGSQGPPAPATLSIGDASLGEGGHGTSLLAFPITRSDISTQATTVTFTTSDLTATAGSDYVSRFGTATIPAGETSVNVVIVVNGDGSVEADETFQVTLTRPTNAALRKGVATGTLVNDDPAAAATTLTQYRLYHDGTKEHLYTTDSNEYSVLGTRGWSLEGVAYRMLTNGIYGGVQTAPLFRLYHPGILQHFWTTDSNEATTLASTGIWSFEGTVGYLCPSQAAGTIPLYRMSLANPPIHLWTTDLNEYSVLQTRGWTGEGIIGYVVP